MSLSVAYLGPPGTYAELAALHYVNRLAKPEEPDALLCPYPTISQALEAVAQAHVQIAVVPVENSTHGSVGVTLDTLWQLDCLKIQHALVLPIAHALLSQAASLADIRTVYSHPQALGQCQEWIAKFLPNAQLIPTNSTTEALQFLDRDTGIGAISSQRAAELYTVPILAYPINDRSDNCTRFWSLSLAPGEGGNHTSLAFSLPANAPGALVKPLQIFAQRGINLSKIESRPTKRSLGDYLFFIDLEANLDRNSVRSALEELHDCTETLKLFGSYSVVPGPPSPEHL